MLSERAGEEVAVKRKEKLRLLFATLERTGYVITIRDIYATAILDYMMYRALAKDAEEASNAQLSANYYQSFLAGIGMKDQAEQENSPNMKLGPIHGGRGGAK